MYDIAFNSCLGERLNRRKVLLSAVQYRIGIQRLRPACRWALHVASLQQLRSFTHATQAVGGLAPDGRTIVNRAMDEASNYKRCVDLQCQSC